MALPLANQQLLVLAITLFLCLSVESYHYSGGSMHWKVAGYSVDRTHVDVVISHRVAWQNSANAFYCTQSIVEATVKARYGGGVMSCTTETSSNVMCPESTFAGGRDFICTDYNSGASWSSGAFSITQRFPLTGSDSYFVGYKRCCWAVDITAGNYGLTTAINLVPRLDNTKLNSSPKTTMIPIVQVQRGCTEDIRIPMLDDDGDYVSCRFATNPNNKADACYSLCNVRVPDVVLNPADTSGCTLRVPASGSRSKYAVALVIEDRITPNANPMSSVSLQFVLNYYGDQTSCLPSPTFVADTPAYGATVVAQPTDAGMSASINIVVRSSADNQFITHIVTLSPLNTEKTALSPMNSRESSITVTFVQGADQPSNDLMCFYGIQTNEISSKIRCITLAFDLTVPQILLDQLTPRIGEAVDPNFDLFEIVFDQEVKRPLLPRNIQLFNFNSDVAVQTFNTFESEDLVFPDVNSGSGRIPINIMTPLVPGQYYIQADEGAVVGSVIGGLGSEALGPRVWHFNVTGTPPDPCLTPNLCQNGGTCSPLQGNTGFTCRCDADFMGTNCNTQNPCVSADVCLNGATCNPNADFTNHTCSCAPNFMGDRCENEDPCLSGLCQNGATCTPSLANTVYTCNCADGFLGMHCENEDPCQAVPSVCENNGECKPINQNTDFECTCRGAFIGKNCSEPLPIDPCTFTMICENGGTCQTLTGEFNYTCKCADGFMGRNCRDEFDCPDFGRYSLCVAPCGPTCFNPMGGSGENCTDPCTEGCVCNDGYLLEDGLCKPAAECGCVWNKQYIHLHGMVMNHNCTERCSCVSNGTLECVSIMCSDDATCMMRDDHYTCMCNEGFEGNGLECRPGTRFDERETCTKPECKRGCFTSPNYPEDYKVSWIKQYIVSVPGAMYYTVKCDELFHIEKGRDALYVGPGDPPPSNTLPIDPEDPILLLDGETPPERFLIDDGDMWMYFVTDRLEQHEGWKCCWIADDPCFKDPCMNGGKCEGQDDGSYSCVCVGDWRGKHCDLGLAHCSARGDPHYTSFDGKHYDFQGACKYYLVKYCGGDDKESFHIIQENEPPSNNARVTITKEITIKIYGLEIGMHRDKSLTIDGVQQYLPVIRPNFHISFSGNHLVARFNNSLEVEWTGRGVNVELSYEYSNQTCGLCGNMDMDDDNDFKTPDDEEAKNAAEFGNSWKYNTTCGRDDDPELSYPCKGLPFALDDASHFCSVINKPDGPFRHCHEEVKPKTIYDDCVYDRCATHPQLDACDNIASYAAVCRSHGIEVGPWRKEEFCPLRCPEHSRYKPCMTACPSMCGVARQNDFMCPFPCVEGCECEDGYILDGNQKCVLQNRCGCSYEGAYHLASEVFYNSDCSMECRCVANVPLCSISSCHARSFCGIADKHHGCHCNVGFIGDGKDCAVDPCASKPCNRGKCMQDKSHTDGYYCRCMRGSQGKHCDEERGHCYAHGDPHYKTFDGKKYNFQGDCKYTILQPCGPAGVTPFTVIQDNEKAKKRRNGASVTAAVYVHVYNQVIFMDRKRRIIVNGTSLRLPVTLPGIKITKQGKKVILRTDFGLEVRWNRKHELDISVPSTYYNNTCGLCGSWNGNKDDDFGHYQGPKEFGNKWKINDEECPAAPEPPALNCEPPGIIIIEDYCRIVFSNAFEGCKSLGLAQTFFDNCVFDLCVTSPELTNLCPSTAVYADLCQENGLDVRPWRSRQFCPLECPEHSRYTQCASACPATCSQPKDQACPHLCVEGCECDDGFVYSGEECVRQEECGCEGPMSYYEPGETYISPDCRQRCTCNGQNETVCVDIPCHVNATCEVQDEELGCHCNEGFYRSKEECLPDPCLSGEEHCSGNGKCVSHNDGTFHCECNQGWSGKACDDGMGVCSASGDPHYRSFDRKKFDYQGKCRYILAESVRNSTHPGFKVISTHRPAGFNSKVALTKEVAVHVSGLEIDLLQGKEVRVNNMVVNPPAHPTPGVSIEISGKHVIVTTNFSLVVKWDGRTSVRVGISANYFNQTQGLCGTYDGNKKNDFKTPEGEIVDGEGEFGNSWVYGECGTPEPPGGFRPCEEAGDGIVEMAENLCEIITDEDGPFRECHSVLDEETYYMDCKYDLCSTLPDRGALCDDIAQFADDCRGAGVSIESWRTEEFCPFPCPEGSSYTLCASGCPETCESFRERRQDNTSNPVICRRRCVEGCDCTDGLVLGGGRCVRPEDCGCRYGSRYIEHGEHFIKDDCEERCECMDNGEIACEQLQCHENAECAVRDGQLKCHCQHPLIGDGIQECNLNPCFNNPCKNFGTCILLDDGEYICQCTEVFSGRHCATRLGSCYVYGSLHYTTFDGIVFVFQGECQYVMAKTCLNDVEPAFEVIQENVRFTPKSSVIKAIHVHIGNKVITLGREKQCYVDGQRMALPIKLDGIQIRVSGFNLELRTEIGLTVFYDGLYSAAVFVDPSFSRKMCGLCGNYDGNYENELLQFDSATELGNFYIRGDGCALPLEPEVDDTYDPCKKLDLGMVLEAETFCSALAKGPLKPCSRRLNTHFFLQRCKHDACESELNIPLMCLHPANFVSSCRKYGGITPSWRTVQYCPVDCPRGSHFNMDTSGCQQTCSEHRQGITPRCNQRRVEACECDDDHFLSGGECVPAAECGCIDKDRYYQQGYAFVHDDCTKACECHNGEIKCSPFRCDDNAECELSDGRRSCKCSDGFIGNGMTCKGSPCVNVTCENDGKCMAMGNASYVCSCKRGYSGDHCEIETKQCTAKGDPHYKTFDSVRFNFQGECRYFLVQNCKDQEPYFDVIQQNLKSVSNPKVARTSEVWIHFYDMEIGLFREKRITVNGQEIMPPFTHGDLFQINRRSGKVIVKTNFTLEVLWNGKDRVYVKLSTQYANQTCGLCGNMDGSKENELASPGNDDEDPNTFGNYWVANHDKCSSIEPPGGIIECPDEELERFRLICGPLTDARGPFRRCPDDMTESAFDDCVYDGCALRPDTTTICETFADTMKLCQRNGFEIDQWRRTDFCPYQCPPQSTYKICANACQRRCGEAEHPDDFECPHPCEEGCECNNGHVLDSDDNCKPTEECGCFDDGLYHLGGVPYMRQGCRERCRCENGEPKCEAVMCHRNASCTLDDGDRGCHCDEGFLGNGMQCMDDPCEPNPCENDGRCSPIQGGMSYICTCIGRWMGQNCTEGVGACSLSDPNYRTLDGRSFTFYGGCSYVLLQPCVRNEGFFSVVIENEPNEDIPRLSNVKAVHVDIAGMTIVLKQGLEVEVDGQRVNLQYNSKGFSIMQLGRRVGLFTDFGMTLIWDGKALLDISLSLHFRGSTCGVCGNFNDDPEDDFGEYENAYQFASSWSTNNDTCSSPVEPFEPCGERPEIVTEALDKCSLLLSPEIACPPGWIEKDDDGINKCYYIKTLEDPLSYAPALRECKKLGADLIDVESEAEQSFIAERIDMVSYWVFCNDREDEGHWRCPNGDHWYRNSTENQGYWPWVDGLPDNGRQFGADSDCIRIESSNQWQDVPCGASVKNLICQLDRPRTFENVFEACHEVLPPKVYFEGCLTSVCATLPDEKQLCRSVEGYADECRLYGVDIGPWRSRDRCPLECPERSFYSRCVSICQPTCAIPERTCDNQCEPGCQCEPGLLRQGNDCISPDQCGCVLEDSAEFFLPGQRRLTENCTETCVCIPGGEFECQAINCIDNATCVFDDVYKCECADGFFFVDGECRPDACTGNPCKNNAKCEVMRNGTFQCCCPYGYTGDLCEKEDAWCKTSGAHGIRTFDQSTYFYYSDCLMTLAQQCPENDTAKPMFKITKKNRKHDLRKEAFEVSWMRIEVHDLVIELKPGKGVLVNNVWKNLPITNYDGIKIKQSGLNVDLKFEFGLSIIWNGYADLLIHTNEELKGQLCGLCGSYDNVTGNDFYPQDGNMSVSTAEFVNSWADDDEEDECMPDSGRIVSLGDVTAFCPDRIDSVRTYCNEEVAGLSDQCAGVLADNFHLDTCILDKCFKGDWTQGCTRIANTVGMCRLFCGRPEPFRTPAAQCDVPCPGNSNYKFCMNPCAPTCDSMMGGSQDECPRTACVEGCQCDEGFVLSGKKCVRREDCGCRDLEGDGAYYLNGEEFVREDCHEACECEEGEIKCEPLDCHCDATCGAEDGKYGCHCPPPYDGDGLTCRVDPCNSNPCMNDGECVTLKTPKLSLMESAFVCICKAPWTGIRCELPQAGCCSHGIPQHIHIFDKAVYNFFGTCWYRFVEPCHSYGDPSFRVHIRNVLVPNTPGLTKLSEIRIELGRAVVINMYEGKRFTINGTQVNAPVILPGVGILTSGSHLILSTTLGVTIRWDGDSDLNVIVPKNNFTGPLCGLCGNVDGDPANLFVETPDGHRVSNSVEFGNSWIVDDSDCQDSGNDFQDVCNGVIERSAAEARCEIMKDLSGPFADCISRINPAGFFNDCVYDVCATTDPRTVCRHLSILEAHCLDSSFEVGFWRSPENCDPHCPRGSDFRRLTKPCPRTCLEALAEISIPCGYADQAGCECAPGHYLSMNECVPKHQCGCVYDEIRYAKPHEQFVTGDCEKRCTCYPGNRLECQSIECHERAFCGFNDGRFGCHCAPGFEGNGMRCSANPCASSPCKNDGECVFVDDFNYFCHCPKEFYGKNCETVLHRCSVVGDSHYQTFDGVSYDYMGHCEDTLVTSCNMDGGLEVVKFNQTSDGKTAIRITSRALANSSIELRQDKVIYIGDERYQPPIIGFAYDIYLSGSWLVLVMPVPGMLIRWDGDQQVEIFVSDALSNRLCGLCGTFDKNAGNEFVTPLGDKVPTALEFGNSWDSCGNTVEVFNPCDNDTARKAQADTACNILRDTVGLLRVCFSKIPPELYYKRCEYDLCMSLPDTTDRCANIRDYVQLCINAGVQIDSKWRDQTNCYLRCPNHSTYSSCTGACPPSCLSEILFKDPRQCWQYCNDGCVCDEGYVLSGFRCLPRDRCGCQVFLNDGSGWELLPVAQSKLQPGCTTMLACNAEMELALTFPQCSSDAQCLNVDGKIQCVCNGNLVGDGHQCSESPCKADTCKNGGTCKVLSATEHDCICLRGWIGPECVHVAKYCMVHGDPHYKTFDDTYYDFMGDCAYTLVYIDGVFRVVQINEQFEGTAHTTMKELIVYFNSKELKLLQNKVVMLDGVIVKPPFYSTNVVITLAGNYIIASFFDGDFVVKWNGVDSVDIANIDSGGDFSGLCGNKNGNGADDFLNPVTNTNDPIRVFGDRHKFNTSVACPQEAVQPNPPCLGQFDLEFPERICGVLKDTNGPFKDCTINVEPFSQACKYDICASNTVDTTHACGVIAAYAQVCHESGHQIGTWRMPTRCELTCPYNAVYSQCADPCPKSCMDNTNTVRHCALPCVEGCTCEEGFYQDGDKCVSPDNCGCFYGANGSKYVQFDEHIYNESCSMKCTCTEAFGEVECEPVTCHENATCQDVNQLQQCVCDEGFVGDGETCFFAECANSPCADGAECLRRQSGNPNYVCQCNTNGTMGFNCDVPAVYNERSMCFGAECSTGWFKSPGYPNNYPSSFKGFYIIWVPQAHYINITFPGSFALEKNRDVLYVGPGFQYPLNLNDGPVASEPGAVYHLDGYQPPGPIYIIGDAAWFYFLTDDAFSINGWHAAWEAGFDVLQDRPLCWDGSETRLSGRMWDYGKCDNCNCEQGTISCTLVASKPISCVTNFDCPGASMCVPSTGQTTCAMEPCDGSFCNRGTVYEDCNANPKCSAVTISADPTSLAEGTTVSELCDNILTALNMGTTGSCFTYECALRNKIARKKRATTSEEIVLDIFLETDSSTEGATPTSAPGDLQPVDSLALSLVEQLQLHRSDGSLPINITDIIYNGPTPHTQAPLTTKDKATVKKEEIETFDTKMPISTILIIAAGCFLFTLVIVIVMITTWCRFHGHRTSKKTMTFEHASEEAHTNEVYEMTTPQFQLSPAFARAVPLNDGTGVLGNVYGLKYDMGS